jgi:hypothetical protein
VRLGTEHHRCEAVASSREPFGGERPRAWAWRSAGRKVHPAPRARDTAGSLTRERVRRRGTELSLVTGTNALSWVRVRLFTSPEPGRHLAPPAVLYLDRRAAPRLVARGRARAGGRGGGGGRGKACVRQYERVRRWSSMRSRCSPGSGPRLGPGKWARLDPTMKLRIAQPDAHRHQRPHRASLTSG